MATKNYYDEQCEKTKSHTIFYHYTTLESLENILLSKTFRLSQLKNVNDHIEETRIDPLLRNKIFTVCFCHNESESITMWKKYANDKFGICLVFRNLEFLEDEKNYNPNEGWEVREAKLIDILYLDDNAEILKFENQRCIGFVKKKIWEYENETRVRCYIDVASGNLSIKSIKDGKYNYPDFDYIFCNIPDEILISMQIIFSPFLNAVQKDIVMTTVKRHLLNFENKNFLNSNLEER